MIRHLPWITWAIPRAIQLAFYHWAAREIHPLHPDVGLVRRRIVELEEQLTLPWSR